MKRNCLVSCIEKVHKHGLWGRIVQFEGVLIKGVPLYEVYMYYLCTRAVDRGLGCAMLL